MVKNIGGIRENAGRKKINVKNKKIPVQIYMDNELKEEIKNKNIFGHKSISQKCNYLIKKSLTSEEQEDKNCVKFIDLFAGLGGIRIGFNEALKQNGLKGKCVFTSEIKKSAIKAYRSNFGLEEPIYGDITQIKASEIPDFDYLLGGFPCQSFSTAGKRLGFNDTRGTLFFDIARILKEKKPKGFLLENVENLLNHDHGKTFKVIRNTLLDLGYSVGYKVLSGTDFGLAQNRKRIYIIGNRNKQVNSLFDNEINMENLGEYKITHFSEVMDLNIPPLKDDFSDKLLSHYSIDAIKGKSIKDKRGGKNNIHSWEIGLKGEISDKEKNLLNSILKERRKHKWADELGIKWMDGMPLTEKMISTFYPDDHLHEMLLNLTDKNYIVYEYPKQLVNGKRQYDENLEKGYNIVTGKLSFQYSKILNPDDVTPTLVATDIAKLAVPINNGIRPLTIREGLRLFGFPESYKLECITKNQAYDLLGNTVCVPVIKAVANRLLNS